LKKRRGDGEDGVAWMRREMMMESIVEMKVRVKLIEVKRRKSIY
jgi:hypothetical protein